MDADWLRERAEQITAQGGPDSNVKAAALLEAANDLDAPAATADAAP